ncbi:MAG: hypothetical protein ACYSUM_03805 [Planctomycetota bacterium]|jgi:hypothetical protein
MRYVAAILLLATVAGAGDRMTRRVNELVARWKNGDEAARAGVLAETKALGDQALAELFRRLGRPRCDFPARDPGVEMAPANAGEPSDRLVALEVRFAEPTRPGLLAIAKTRLLDQVEEASLKGKVQTISAPRLTCFDGQRANISILERLEYVKTFDADRKVVTGTVQTGLVLGALPRIVGKSVTLELRFVETKLKRPLVKLATRDGEIEMPELVKRETGLTLKFEDGGRATLALKRDGDAPPLVLALHARIVKLDPQEIRRAAPEER